MAARMPAGTPISVAMRMAQSPSSTVAGNSVRNSVQDRLLGDQRIAEDHRAGAAQEVEILHPHRLIEAELCRSFGVALGRHAALARHQQHRIAGQNPDEAEGDERDAEEGRDQIKKFGE
jgi:hypothetical protein